MPEYLRTADDGVTNYMDWGISLGRRFRALKLWFVIRYFGRGGIAARLREHVRLGQQLAAWVDADPDFERLAPAPFSVVCSRARPRNLASRAGEPDVQAYLDALNDSLLAAVNATGEAFLSHTKLNGQFTLRLAIGNIRTSEGHVRRAWDLLRGHAARLDRERRPVALG